MTFDVAVVGAGPAATMAAIFLRRAGRSVRVVAARRQRLKPTETAKPQLRYLLRSAGLESALLACEPCHGVVSDWGVDEPFFKPSITNPFGTPWFINRTNFDCELERLAKNAGVDWMSASANDANFCEDHVLLKTTDGDVRAKWLIIANGSLRWASRVSSTAIATNDSLIACWARLDCTRNEKLLYTETSPDGWWYLCPDLNGGTIACLVTDQENNRTLKPYSPERWYRLFLNTNLSAGFPNLAPPQRICVLHTGLARLAKKYSERWVSAGDSAMVLDPLGSSGTATALDSAQRVALAVNAAFEGQRNLLDQYEKWSDALFQEFNNQRNALYQAEAKQNSGHFWLRRIALNKSNSD